MPIATTNHSPTGATSEKSAGVTLAKQPTRQPLATPPADSTEHDAHETLDNPYDNLACTD